MQMKQPMIAQKTGDKSKQCKLLVDSWNMFERSRSSYSVESDDSG